MRSWVLLLIVLICTIKSTEAIDNPIIGILGVPTSEGCITYIDFATVARQLNGHVLEATSCFTSYYVKWIESGGGRVVPIRYDAPEEELRDIFSKLNGILFTGGELELTFKSTYVKTANTLLNMAISSNDKGEYFPIWGTCMGFQMLNMLVAKDESVVQPGFDSNDISWPLNITSTGVNSRLFSGVSSDAFRYLQTEDITLNLHHDGVTPESYQKNTKLRSFFNILSTNMDRVGREFVSTMEAYKYPIYASQWHPERQIFEFNTVDTGINHSLEAIRANHEVVTFFIQEARKSTHHFHNETELESYLIYNYNPHYTGQSRQVYVY
eukprot:TRINITY_DN2908_c0_g1_i1.p1 TRINITY_DN2908_c0_g1~~TRINITY_DN2908_c0_g1_i1.p1  ORF type:complete len:325 (-),score=46.80 TRINITY_DN2908_c0_g1_i1:24-998(-)